MSVVTIDASFVSSLSGSQSITVGAGKLVSAAFTSSMGGGLSLSVVRSVPVAAALSSAMGGSLMLTGTGQQSALVSAGFHSAMSGATSLTVGTTRAVGASFTSSLSGRVNLSGASDSEGMSICGVVHEILMLWGIACMKSAPSYAIERALNDVNAALQMVWNQASDRTYWTSETLTLNLTEGESSIDLPDDIQNVIGPCRRSDNKQPLTPLGTLGELDTFNELYFDGETAEEPVAYHIDRMAQAGSEPAKCVMHVTPEVQEASLDLLLDVVRESPRYTTADLDSCPLIPIPHQYVETLLLPIARYRASGYTLLFNRPERQEVIDREYIEARVALGLADPLPGNAGDNRPKKEVSK